MCARPCAPFMKSFWPAACACACMCASGRKSLNFNPLVLRPCLPGCSTKHAPFRHAKRFCGRGRRQTPRRGVCAGACLQGPGASAFCRLGAGPAIWGRAQRKKARQSVSDCRAFAMRQAPKLYVSKPVGRPSAHFARDFARNGAGLAAHVVGLHIFGNLFAVLLLLLLNVHQHAAGLCV